MALLVGSADDFFQVFLGYRAVVHVVAPFIEGMEELFDGHEAFLVQFQFVFPRCMAQRVGDFL
jgi:hypothetical protein